ncbi:MAG: hypothetical protein ACOX2O_00785 [Bdellovibrionota bacterium]
MQVVGQPREQRQVKKRQAEQKNTKQGGNEASSVLSDYSFYPTDNSPWVDNSPSIEYFYATHVFPSNDETTEAINAFQEQAYEFKKQFLNSKEVMSYIISLVKKYLTLKRSERDTQFFYDKTLKSFKKLLHEIIPPYFKTSNSFNDDDIKILIKHATNNFYAYIISKIRKDIKQKDIDDSNETKLKTEKVKLLENIISSYHNLTEKRNYIVDAYRQLINYVINKDFYYEDRNATQFAGLLGLIEAIDTYDSKKEIPFKNYAIIMIKFSIQKNLRRTRRGIVDLSFADLAGDGDDSDYHGQVADPRDPYSQKNVETAHKLLGYTYGKAKYIIQISCGFYAKNEYEYYTSLGVMSYQRAHQIYQITIEKLKFISEAINYSLTQDEIKDIKNEIKEKLPTIPNNYRQTISKHLGLDGNREYSRAELCEDFNCGIETTDTYIFNALKGTFSKDPKMFNKALKFSLTIEDEFIKENIYPLPHNLYSILTEEESRFLKCRYDWKKGIFKDLNQVANDLNTDITELIEIERRVIEKLKQYEPETFPKIGAIFKANIESGNIQSSFDKNSLFMLSSLQFEIINLRHGITTSEKLSKEDIIEKLSIDAQTYDKEYKNAVSILREFRLNTNES